MDRIEVTESELIAALRAAFDAPGEDDGSLTIRELAAATGWGAAKAREHLRRLIQDGAAEPVRSPRTNLAGQRQPVVAYRLTRKAQLKAA